MCLNMQKSIHQIWITKCNYIEINSAHIQYCLSNTYWINQLIYCLLYYQLIYCLLYYSNTELWDCGGNGCFSLGSGTAWGAVTSELCLNGYGKWRRSWSHARQRPQPAAWALEAWRMARWWGHEQKQSKACMVVSTCITMKAWNPGWGRGTEGWTCYAEVLIFGKNPWHSLEHQSNMITSTSYKENWLQSPEQIWMGKTR